MVSVWGRRNVKTCDPKDLTLGMLVECKPVVCGNASSTPRSDESPRNETQWLATAFLEQNFTSNGVEQKSNQTQSVYLRE